MIAFHPFTIRIAATATAILLTSMTAMAQDEKVQLQFVSFPKLADAKPLELRIGDDKVIEVDLPTNSISRPQLVPRMTAWSLGKSGVDSEGNFHFESYGNCASIAAKKQVILVIRKGATDQDGLELIAIDGGAKGFGGGSYLLQNAAKIDIAGTIGDGKFGLQPKHNTLLKPGPSKVKGKQKYCYATIYFRKGEAAEPFFSSTWRFSEKARTMVFFYHDPSTKQLRLHTIRDYVK